MKTLNLETTAPFQGLAELVAYEEGLFALEGLDIKWVDRDPTENNVEIIKRKMAALLILFIPHIQKTRLISNPKK